MPAPIISRQKSPSNFNLGFSRVVAMKPGGSDDLLILLINNDKRSAGFQRLFEEHFKNVLLVAIALRMLLPDERVGRDGKEKVPVFRHERVKLDQFAF